MRGSEGVLAESEYSVPSTENYLRCTNGRGLTEYSVLAAGQATKSFRRLQSPNDEVEHQAEPEHQNGFEHDLQHRVEPGFLFQ
jgi:hypothetical protein